MDAFQSWPPDDNGETQSLIRRCAKRLLRRSGLPSTDHDEVEQHLTVELWQQSQEFDPRLGSWTDFAKARTFQNCTKYRRHKRALRRDPRRCQSLSVNVQQPSGERMELASVIRSDEARKHRCIYSESPEKHVDAAIDARRIIARAPDEWHMPITMLSESSICQVAKASGIKRTTLSSRLKNLRRSFPDYFQI